MSLTSKKTKRRTVLGPRRTKAGVQPLKRNFGPSSLNDCISTLTGVVADDYKLDKYEVHVLGVGPTEAMTRDLRTSAGEQTAENAGDTVVVNHQKLASTRTCCKCAGQKACRNMK